MFAPSYQADNWIVAVWRFFRIADLWIHRIHIINKLWTSPKHLCAATLTSHDRVSGKHCS